MTTNNNFEPIWKTIVYKLSEDYTAGNRSVNIDSEIIIQETPMSVNMDK